MKINHTITALLIKDRASTCNNINKVIKTDEQRTLYISSISCNKTGCKIYLTTKSIYLDIHTAHNKITFEMLHITFIN